MTEMCSMCEGIAEEAKAAPEIWGPVEVKQATVFDKWPEPVCDEHDAWLDKLGMDLSEMEAEDPDLAKLSAEVKRAVSNVMDGHGCTERGCLMIHYRRVLDGAMVSTHVHMTEDAEIERAMRAATNMMTVTTLKDGEVKTDGPPQGS